MDETGSKKKERLSTRIKKQEFLERLKANAGLVLLTCEETRVSKSAYYEWLKKDKEFARKVDEIEARNLEVAKGRLYKAIADGNITAIIFYLVNKSKGEFINIQKVEHNAPEFTNKIDKLINEIRGILKK